MSLENNLIATNVSKEQRGPISEPLSYICTSERCTTVLTKNSCLAENYLAKKSSLLCFQIIADFHVFIDITIKVVNKR